jgi:hypothetical protein
VLAVLFGTSKRNRMFGVSFYHEVGRIAVSSGSEQQSLLHRTFTSYPKMCTRLFASTVL